MLDESFNARSTGAAQEIRVGEVSAELLEEARMKFARRLDQVPPYLFAEIERRIDAMDGWHRRDLAGIGDPDLPTPPAVVEALQQAAARPETHRYPSNHGLAVFREAVVAFCQDRFGVSVDPESEVILVLGGKEAVAHVALAVLDPDDVALAPDPGYPPYTRARSSPVRRCTTCPVGGERVHTRPRLDPTGDPLEGGPPLLQLPDQPDRRGGRRRLLRASGGVRARARACCDPRLGVLGDRLRRLPSPSFLAAPGAMEVGAEIFLSKGWNMTGWRVGWIAGNGEVVERYRRLKTNLDSGMFDALQLAGAAALTRARDFPAEMSEIYRRRRDLMIAALRAIGMDVEPPWATPYLWIRVTCTPRASPSSSSSRRR